MANSIPLLLPLSILWFVSIPMTVSSITQKAATTVARDQVPCTMCTECENPCKPLPPPPPAEIECPPPPPPVVIECPPPPPPPPPPVVLCPPPPKPPCTGPCETLPPPAPPSCPENCETPPSTEKPCEKDGTCVPTPVPPMPWTPLGPPGSLPYGPPAPGNPYPVEEEPDEDQGGKLKPFAAFSLSLLLLVPLI